jgi:hypothetical protein
MSERLDQRLVVNPLVVVKPMPTGAVLMHTVTGECFELNRLGAEIWKEIERGAFSSDTAHQIADRYKISAQTVADDVSRLIEQFLRQDIVRASAA